MLTILLNTRFYILLPSTILLALFLNVSGCTVNKGEHTPTIQKKPGMAINNSQDIWWNLFEHALLLSEERMYRKAEKVLQKAIKGNDFDQWQSVINDTTNIDYFPHRELGIIHFQRQEYTKAIKELEYSLDSASSAKAIYYLNKARAAKIAKDEVDLSAPELFLETSTTKEVTRSFTKSVKGVARDDNYIASFQVQDQYFPLEPAIRSHVFTAELLLDEGENSISIRATDLGDNVAEKQLQIFCDRLGPLIEIMETEVRGNEVVIRGTASDKGGLRSLIVNGRNWPIADVHKRYNFKFAQPTGPFTVAARDRAGNVTQVTLQDNELVPDGVNKKETAEDQNDLPPSSRPSPEDTVPPAIRLEGLVSEQKTFQESILFNVRISDSSDIHSIFVNTEPILHRTGKKVFFSLLKKLTVGDNKFHFIAFDQHGNKTDQKFTITRLVRKIDQPDSRMSISIRKFDQQGNVEPPDPDVSGKLFSLLAEQKRFHIIDHITTSLSPLTQFSINAELTGTVKFYPGHVEIIARLSDPETSKIIASHDVFGKFVSPEDLDLLLMKLARKFNSDFPLTKGLVTDLKDKEVILDLGTKEGIIPYSWFTVYRDTPPFKHPVTGVMVEPDPDILGILQINEVHEDFSTARIINGENTIRKYDRVIAR